MCVHTFFILWILCDACTRIARVLHLRWQLIVTPHAQLYDHNLNNISFASLISISFFKRNCNQAYTHTHTQTNKRTLQIKFNEFAVNQSATSAMLIFMLFGDKIQLSHEFKHQID